MTVMMIQLVIVQVIVFVILVFVFQRIINNASTEENQRLQQLSQQTAQKSLEIESKMKEVDKLCKQKVLEAEDDVRKLRNKVAEETEKMREEAVKKGHQEADRLTQQALSTKDKIREELLNEQAERVNEQALKLVKEVLKSKSLELVHSGLVHEMIEQMNSIDTSKLKINADRGELISPVKLEKEDRDKLIAILSKKIGKTVELNDVIDQDYVAGVCIKLGSLVIDGTLAKKLKEAAANLKRS